MIITGGQVFGDDKTFTKRDLYIENHKIAASKEEVTDSEVIDAEGLYVLPGLVDIHSHGACGHDFSDADAEGLRTILRYEYAHGITSYCPTSMTLPKERLQAIFSTAALVKAQDNSTTKHTGSGSSIHDKNAAAADNTTAPQAHIAGINMEGPFLDPSKKGAHVEEYITSPDAALFRECNELSGGLIRLVTLAPNMPGAMEFIQELHQETTISLGHTAADYDTASAALKTGAHHVTHLYNAMQPLAHRSPGLIGAASDDPQCMAELICDGIHIHAGAVRAAFRLFPERIVLISDSMRAAGMPNGVYDLGGQQVHVNGSLATLADGTIAGSATNLYDCMRTAVSFGIPLEEAVAAASMNPAKSIGIFDTVGSLTPGKQADILLVDKDLKLVRVLS